MSQDFRKSSRASYQASDKSTYEEINCGSLQRIADATEIMAQEYNELLRQKNMCWQQYEEQRKRIVARDKTISCLKGQITKLKKRLTEKKEG